jgi:glycosyltransferase involved in cell wall biosynthesis
MVTVVITAFNEERHIVDCVKSVNMLTNNVLVVDLYSTDKTTASALAEGAHVLSYTHVEYVEPARMYGIHEATDDWVLILDPDERMTQELANEIRQSLVSSSALSPNGIPWDSELQALPITHFRIPRKNIFGAKTWLKHGGWWPDHQIRLIKKSAIKDWPARIHSTPVIEGQCKYLTNPIIHYFHGDLTQMVEKTIKFEDIESDLLYEAKRSVNNVTFFRKYLGELFRRLIRYQGFRDGLMGWIESIYQAYSKTITYFYLYEKSNIRNSK